MRSAPCLTFVALVCAWSHAAKADSCTTTIPCEAPGERACTAPARSAGALNFYWRVALQPGHRYICEMDAQHHVQVLADHCSVPEGVALAWEACCKFEPAIAKLDTQAMQVAEGDAIIKFQVGPTDIPSDVHIACRFADADVENGNDDQE